MSTHTPGDLIGALEVWRKCEKRHAMIVLGEIEADEVQREGAKEKADRALHEVRKMADSVHGAVLLPFRTAEVVRNVFLPRNPNKLRHAHADTLAAAKDYIARFDLAAGICKGGHHE